MTCNEAVELLLDGGQVPPPALESHLDSCTECRGLAAAHHTALSLRGLPVAVAAPVSIDEVRRSVRRRRRRASVAAGMAAAAVLGMVVWRSAAEPVSPAELEPIFTEAVEPTVEPTSPSLLAEVPEVPEVPDPEPSIVPVTVLVAEADTYTRRDPSIVDPAYAVFGGLPVWLAPPRGGALDLEPLRKALRPLQHQ